MLANRASARFAAGQGSARSIEGAAHKDGAAQVRHKYFITYFGHSRGLQ
jgi:hypothetical protein